jgi:hypothetical protein
MMRRKLICFTTLVLLLQAGALVADPEQEWSSRRGIYTISFEAELDPIEINKIHSWVLSVRTSSGEPVTTAEISVLGGMPLHDHGMPTRPRVTEYLGEGRYRLEGMRFHMNGRWEVSVTVKADGKVDTAVIALDL